LLFSVTVDEIGHEKVDFLFPSSCTI